MGGTFSLMRMKAQAGSDGGARSPSPSKAETMMHPLRLRILNALEGRRLAPREIGTLMPEVPQATLYRHIARLHDAGLIAVAEERAVGGATERVFTAVREKLTLSHADLKSATREEIGAYIRSF